MINQRPTLQEIAINLVKDVRRRSTCQRRQQSCAITDSEYWRILAYGYNGRASGEEHGCDSLEAGKCNCIHAETNALIKLDTHLDNLILICTQSPCIMCARLIVNSRKIRKVFYFEPYRDLSGVNLLKRFGIDTKILKM